MDEYIKLKLTPEIEEFVDYWKDFPLEEPPASIRPLCDQIRKAIHAHRNQIKVGDMVKSYGPGFGQIGQMLYFICSDIASDSKYIYDRHGMGHLKEYCKKANAEEKALIRPQLEKDK